MASRREGRPCGIRRFGIKWVLTLGRALWRQVTGYHRRSRVETKMHCVKLLGQRLSARDFDRQVAEIQIRIAVLNRYTALGIPVTETVA